MVLTLPAGCHLIEHDADFGGLASLRVSTPAVDLVVLPHGAHLCQWQPAGERPVLWMSASSRFEDDVAVRGGVPICFPWFGPGRSGDRQPAHGWARLVRWSVDSVDVDEVGTATIVLSLTADQVAGREGADALGDFSVRYTITAGDELDLALKVTAGAVALDVEQALHTYLGVDDVRTARVDGLDGVTYLDKVTGETSVQDGPVTFTAETDRVYDSATPVTLVADRMIEVSSPGASRTVVWNPWVAKAAAMPDFGDDEWPSMVCIESATVLDGAVQVAPGETHTLGAHYRVR